jgi:hypothetical protein
VQVGAILHPYLTLLSPLGVAINQNDMDKEKVKVAEYFLKVITRNNS